MRRRSSSKGHGPLTRLAYLVGVVISLIVVWAGTWAWSLSWIDTDGPDTHTVMWLYSAGVLSMVVCLMAALFYDGTRPH